MRLKNRAPKGDWKRLGYVAFVALSAEGRRAPIGSSTDADAKLYELQREQMVAALSGGGR